MSLSLNRVDQRARLAIRRDPYWQRLTSGQFIGFRRISAEKPGTWLARFYDGKRYHSQPLGDFADLSERIVMTQRWPPQCDGSVIKAPAAYQAI